MVIELHGVQFGLKSYAWFLNWRSVQHKFDLKSQTDIYRLIYLMHWFFSSPVSRWGRFENGNWTAWSAIWSEIICMISKLKKCAAQVWFEITSMISDKNCTTESLFTTLVHPFWKYKIKLHKYRIFFSLYKWFIDPV